MAYNTKLHRSTGSAWEELRVASDWSLIANKPSTYTPTAHNHDTSYYTQEQVEGLISDAITNTFSFDQLTGILTITTSTEV